MQPTRSPGIQLLGEYAGSGFKDPPALARRADGQVVQLPPLLYDVLDLADGSRDEAGIAESVSDRVHRQVSADDVRFLLTEKLYPLGLVAAPDGTPPPQPEARPFLALTFRTAVVPERVTWLLGRLFRPFFHPVVLVPLLAAFVAFDGWLFGVHGLAQPVREAMLRPGWILLMLGLVVASAAFHEIGHAAGCAYGGARPGRMGCGLYLAWPAFYTDVTDSYRLDRRGRLRTDLGGIWFNALFVLGLGAAFALTRSEPILLAVVVVHFEIAHQLIPVVRLDGYYIVSDLTGVPDLFARIGPILRSLRPRRTPDPRVTALRPWVRIAVASWVAVLLPLLGAELLLILVSLPRIYGTGWASARRLGDAAVTHATHGHLLVAATDGVQVVLLLIPLLGIALLLGRAARALARTLVRTTRGRPVRRALAVVACGVLVVVLARAWLPARNYRPIRPGERGTLTDSFSTGRRLWSGNGIAPAAVVVPRTPTPTPVPVAPVPAPSSVPSPARTGTPAASASPSATVSPTPSPSPSPTGSESASTSPTASATPTPGR